MDKVGKVSWQRFEKFLLAIGCEFKSEEGDHRKYKKSDLLRPIIIPRDKELPQFIISNNLRTLGISKEEFVQIIKNL
jgi:predicted RNA binding protein YcfA (HicA-like mRNA interferase family)